MTRFLNRPRQCFGTFILYALCCTVLLTSLGCDEEYRPVQIARRSERESLSMIPSGFFEMGTGAWMHMTSENPRILLAPGSLIWVWNMKLVYPFRGDEDQPLRFSHQPSMGLLNGVPVFLECQAEAMKWLETCSPKDLSAIRGIGLRKDDKDSFAFLERFKNSGVLIVLRGMDMLQNKKLAQAIADCKPMGLLLDGSKGLGEFLDRYNGLTYLVLTSKNIPDLRKATSLRYLGILLPRSRKGKPGQADKKVIDIAPLESLTELRSLLLVGDCSPIHDFKPITKLRNLRSLALGGNVRLKDLSTLAPLTKLQSLSLGWGEENHFLGRKPSFLRGVDNLSNLKQLALHFPLEKIDLTPVTKLKKLQFFGASTKGQTEEQWKARVKPIQEALPECNVVPGICMGSGWLLTVLGGGLFLGLAAKKWMAGRRCSA